MFGGNSNWRGPLWFPLNYLIVQRPGALPPVLRRRLHGRVPDRIGAAADRSTTSSRTCRTGSSRSSWSARTAGGPASAGSSGCSTTRPGRTTWCSTSTSTATTAPGSAPRTRPAGPGVIADVIRRRHGAVRAIGDVIRRSAAEGAVMTAVAEAGARRALPGSQFPLGATPAAGGTNFAVASGVGRRGDAVPVRRRGHRDPGPAARTMTPASGTASSPASGPGRPTATA